MKEADWLTSTNIRRMLGQAGKLLSDRKRRHFACACCRNIWQFLDKPYRRVVAAAEVFADGSGRSALVESRIAAMHQNRERFDTINVLIRQSFESLERLAVPRAAWEAAEAASRPARALAEMAANRAAGCASAAVRLGLASASPLSEEHAQAAMLRDIVGNPFGPVTLDPRWLSSSVLELSRTIYDERTFERMPFLADALMDAGCDSEEIIKHCRQPATHVRGCWVVDLLLDQK